LGFACLLLAAAYYSKRWEKNDDLLCVLPVLAERERERWTQTKKGSKLITRIQGYIKKLYTAGRFFLSE